MPPRSYARPLQPRLANFGVAVCKWVRRIPRTLDTAVIAHQLIRAAMSPAANYAEAQGAESRRDFVHKLHVCVKELHETATWLDSASQLGGDVNTIEPLRRECAELIAIVVTCINRSKGG